MLEVESIKLAAKAEHFSLCGVAPVSLYRDATEHLTQWRANGRANMLPYMANYQDIRVDATMLLEGAQSAVVCAVNYKSEWSLGEKSSSKCKIACYALLRDYHKTIRKRLRSMLRHLQQIHPELHGRVCVDSAPLLEKRYAVDAGLGWIGRQSLLVTPEHGTFVLLGVLLLDMEVDSYDKPREFIGCAECRKCVDNCPTGAISATSSPHFNTIDSRKCISALTVECDNPESRALHGWIFGCDECQSCCPYNQHSPLSRESDFMPLSPPPTPQEWKSFDEERFIARFASTPLKRAGFARIAESTQTES